MPLYVFKCDRCGSLTEALAKVDQTFVFCPVCPTHDDVSSPPRAHKTITTFARYSIKGNNSASVTPKKFRGGG